MTKREPLTGKARRRKGGDAERAIVNLHKQMNVHAERVGTAGRQCHDVDIYHRGPRAAPMCGEVKARAKIPQTVLKWLADNDLLFLKQDKLEPVVVMPWRTYAELTTLPVIDRMGK